MPQEDRPPFVVAAEWAARITTIGLMMALPALGGWWLDVRLGTYPWLLIVGALFGFAAGFYHLMQVAAKLRANQDNRHRSKRSNQHGNP